jgi:hypothetical protein
MDKIFFLLQAIQLPVIAMVLAIHIIYAAPEVLHLPAYPDPAPGHGFAQVLMEGKTAVPVLPTKQCSANAVQPRGKVFIPRRVTVLFIIFAAMAAFQP